jgi:hypothetical protein
VYKLLFTLMFFCASTAAAAVLNVEFNFTPFIGDTANKEVETVPGKALVFLNNVPVAESEIGQGNAPVLFDDREIASGVWITSQTFGPVLRKGKNTVRIEFTPADPKASYSAQFRWASVTDQTTTRSEGPGKFSATNQGGKGAENKKFTGRAVFERQFDADFAADLPWHHYPPVAAISDDDRKALAQIIKSRADAFKPNFSIIYSLLEGNRNIDLTGVKKTRCLDKVYSAGVRMGASAPGQLEFITTGNPEVVVQGKTGQLFFPQDPSAISRVKDGETQMCAGMVLGVVYPPRLVFVRTPAGKWEVVY